MALLDTEIALQAKGEIPETWTALINSSSFGRDTAMTRRLQSFLKRVFNDDLSETELNLLDPALIEYLAKRFVLSLINAGIDYWSKQPIQQSATGRQENTSYVDRSISLRELRERLTPEVAELWLEVQPLIPTRRVVRGASSPRVRDVGESLTPDPFTFPRPFALPTDTTGAA